MATIKIKIEGKSYEVDSSLTVLEAARACGYRIPTLCNWRRGHNSFGSCRVCLVEIKGPRGGKLFASCTYPVSECPEEKGFEILISSPKAVKARRTSVELLLSNHSFNCQSCVKNGECELLDVSKRVGVDSAKYEGAKTPVTIDKLSPGVVRDTSKCILCGRCINRCLEATGIGILGFIGRGFNTHVGPVKDGSFATSPCIQCGQCINVCPTGALSEKREIEEIDKAKAAGKFVVAQVAPAVRAAISEEFGHKIGEENGEKKMIAALHRLGFDRVFDVNFGADLTIVEESAELLRRMTKKEGPLPQITSCSPGWINYLEYFYPELIPNVSTCKSPHEMQGAITKSYFAKAHDLKPEDIYVVSIMPCTAKKGEKLRKTNAVNGIPDVDCVLTTRELATLIKRSGIMWDELPTNETWDQDLLGEYTGAAAIFGVTGGVMEAALRTTYHTLTGKEYAAIDFVAVRGLEGVKEASVTINGQEIRVAVASGTKNAKPLLDDIKAGKSPYAFIEIMGCPGGCINGGGQPFVKPNLLDHEKADILDTYCEKRAKILYDIDKKATLRQSHKNPDVIKLYKDYLGEVGGKKAEELLHTSYDANRKRYPDLD